MKKQKFDSVKSKPVKMKPRTKKMTKKELSIAEHNHKLTIKFTLGLAVILLVVAILLIA